MQSSGMEKVHPTITVIAKCFDLNLIFFPPLLQFLCLPYFKRLDNKPQSSNSSDLLTITRGTDHVTVIKLFFLLKEKVFQSFFSSVNTQKILLLRLVEGFSIWEED